jgi:hypothetical protein
MFRGLKQPIPKHINEQAKAARIDRPDFYVGPTVSGKGPLGSAGSDRDPDIDAQMTYVRDGARDNARERSEQPRRRFHLPSMRLFRRLQLRRAHPARQP